MKFQNIKRGVIGIVFLCFITALWWKVSRIGSDSTESPRSSTKTGTLNTKIETGGAEPAANNPQTHSLPLSESQTTFRKELGVKQDDIRKLWEDNVLWAGYDRTSAHRIALSIKPEPDVEVGEHYYIYPVTDGAEHAGQSLRKASASVLFRETSRNKILVASIGTSYADHMKLSKPDEGYVLFGHDYLLCWWDTKGPAGEIRFRTPDGPEEGVKDYSMDLVLTAADLYPQKE